MILSHDGAHRFSCSACRCDPVLLGAATNPLFQLFAARTSWRWIRWLRDGALPGSILGVAGLAALELGEGVVLFLLLIVALAIAPIMQLLVLISRLFPARQMSSLFAGSSITSWALKLRGANKEALEELSLAGIHGGVITEAIYCEKRFESILRVRSLIVALGILLVMTPLSRVAPMRPADFLPSIGILLFSAGLLAGLRWGTRAEAIRAVRVFIDFFEERPLWRISRSIIVLAWPLVQVFLIGALISCIGVDFLGFVMFFFGLEYHHYTLSYFLHMEARWVLLGLHVVAGVMFARLGAKFCPPAWDPHDTLMEAQVAFEWFFNEKVAGR